MSDFPPAIQAGISAGTLWLRFTYRFARSLQKQEAPKIVAPAIIAITGCVLAGAAQAFLRRDSEEELFFTTFAAVHVASGAACLCYENLKMLFFTPNQEPQDPPPRPFPRLAS